MKKLLFAVLACALVHSASAAVSFVTAATGYYTTTTCGGSSSLTPTAGDDLVAIFDTFTAGISPGTIVDSQGGTIITDHAFAIDPTSGVGMAVYRVHGATAAAHTITVTWSASASANCFMYLVELHSVGSYDSSQTTVNSGNSTGLVTNALTPSQNGAVLLAVGGTSLSRTLSGWTNGFTSMGSRTAGPTAAAAYLAQATAASISSGNTLSSSATWAALILSYIPTGASSCTHYGLTSGGSIAVPNGSSGSYRLKNGSFGTPDCATVNYLQPTLGNFGLN